MYTCYSIFLVHAGIIINTSDENDTTVMDGVTFTTTELNFTSLLTSQAGLYTCEATMSLFSENDVTLYETVDLQVRSEHMLIYYAVYTLSLNTCGTKGHLYVFA